MADTPIMERAIAAVFRKRAIRDYQGNMKIDDMMEPSMEKEDINIAALGPSFEKMQVIGSQLTDLNRRLIYLTKQHDALSKAAQKRNYSLTCEVRIEGETYQLNPDTRTIETLFSDKLDKLVREIQGVHKQINELGQKLAEA